MGVAGNGNQLADAATPGVVALAIQNEVDGLGGLGADEAVVDVRSRTQCEIRQPAERIPS